MIKLLSVLGIIITLTGCEKATPYYQKAAERQATANCNGVAREFIHQVGIGSSSNLAAQNMYYICISDKGSNQHKVVYKDIPLTYFDFEEK